jgi:hypothetical protein
MVKYADGSYNLVTSTGLCLEGNSQTASQPGGFIAIVMRTCNGLLSQKWKPAATAGGHSLTPQNNLSLCMDVDASTGVYLDGMQMITYTCIGNSADQSFILMLP